MKHPHLWRCFYFDMVKDQPKLHEWNILMEKAYSFSEWYHTTPRNDRAYLCPITPEKTIPATERITLVDILQKSYINGNFDRERKNEGKAIQKYVEEFVLDITTKIGRSNKKFAATTILSGSVAEGTKVGFPDEYDFILHLEELQDEFDQTTIKSNIGTKPHLEVEMETAPLFQEYLDALNEQVKKHEHRKSFSLHQSAESPSIRPFTIVLSYTGIFFKDLKISIDMVPAFKISYQRVQTAGFDISPESANSQIFAIFKETQSTDDHMRLSFSLHERDMMKSLPAYVRNGYRLAKAVRHTELCPGVMLSGTTFASVDEHVTTHMIKTCLLHTMKRCEHNQIEDNEWLSPLSITLAIKIYEQIKFFLEIFEGKIPSYFQCRGDICSRYQIGNQRGEHEEKYQRKRQKVTLTFINYILQLLNELLQQWLQVRCLIQ